MSVPSLVRVSLPPVVALALVLASGASASPASPAPRSAPAVHEMPAPAAGGALATWPVLARGPVLPSSPVARYRWPLDGQPAVVRPFAPPPQPWLPGHRGVDLAGTPGSVVRAAGAGVVSFAGPVGGRGVVSVEHPGGLRTTYEPVSPLVVAGQQVRAGDPIGVLVAGHEGCPVPACLHWGLRRGEVYLDPLSLLGGGRVRLLPLEGGLGGTQDSG